VLPWNALHTCEGDAPQGAIFVKVWEKIQQARFRQLVARTAVVSRTALVGKNADGRGHFTHFVVVCRERRTSAAVEEVPRRLRGRTR